MIVGTAGHIDHGKSALVTALTGRPVDRLAEERKRGITIDLNFAPLELEGRAPIGLVDVPGHEDFVRTMVAGASGIDLVLLVVDAGEGVRPQTLEHLAVVEQLGIPRGIPVLTKTDLADPEWLDLVEAELTERLARSPVAFDRPVRTSAVTGEGIPALREALARHAAAAPDRPGDDVFRMPIDRAFAVAGVGTVVTGTVWSGSLAVGDPVRLEPGGPRAKIRSLEAYGHEVARALPGVRTAVGLAGVDRAVAGRGQMLLAEDSAWEAVRAVDALVRLLPDAPAPLRTRDRVRVHLGTAEVMARIHPRRTIEPGDEGLARLSLEAPLHARAGDRLVLRRYSPVTTIGGGTVVDPRPPRRSAWPADLSSPAPERRLVGLVARRPQGLPDAELAQFTGRSPDAAADLARRTDGIQRIGGTWLTVERTTALRDQLTRRIEDHHESDPSSPGLSVETARQSLGAMAPLADPLLAQLSGEGLVRIDGAVVVRAGFTPRAGGGEAEVARLVAAIAEAGLEPPTTGELAGRLGLTDAAGALRIAAARGEIEPVERDRYYGRAALERFLAAVRSAGEAGDIAPAALRDQLGLSRKFLIPLLEWSDRRGHTRRTPDGRRILA